MRAVGLVVGILVSLGLRGRASPVLETIPTGVEPEKWEALNQILQPYTAKEGALNLAPGLVQVYHSFASQPNVNKICKSRLYAGHVAMLLLMSNPKATVYVYDAHPGPYADDVSSFLQKEFAGRFSFSAKSVESLPAEHPGETCDLMIIGGGHGSDVDMDDVKAELALFQTVATPTHHALLVDDMPCEADWCSAREKAWDTAVKGGMVYEYGKAKLGPAAGMSFGVFRPMGGADALPPMPPTADAKQALVEGAAPPAPAEVAAGGPAQVAPPDEGGKNVTVEAEEVDVDAPPPPVKEEEALPPLPKEGPGDAPPPPVGFLQVQGIARHFHHL